jgi:hypothetical protein
MHRAKKRIAWAVVALATLAILVATLHQGGRSLPLGWSFSLTYGEAALAELIQNLLLFIPLGVSLTLAGVRPRRAILLGALLSFTVEFVQQWIPGRDPSVGDIVCNTASTALGVALVRFAPRWLMASPDRSAWQAAGTAAAAVLVWIVTGAVLRPTFPPPPYHEVRTPDVPDLSRYEGQVLQVLWSNEALKVVATAPPLPPERASPLVAIVDQHDTPVLIFSVDGHDLALRYHMPAARLTLAQPDLRWRGVLTAIAPADTFTAGTWRDAHGVCLGLRTVEHCGLGYTLGDGWKLIFYPERFPGWLLAVINSLWIAGCMIGVGYWAAKGRGERLREEVTGAAIGLVGLGLLLVPLITGLKMTPVSEWIGAVLGLVAGFSVGNRVLKNRLGEDARP